MGLACELMRTLKTTNGILLDFPFLPQQYYAQNTFFKTFLYITQLILFSISFFFIYSIWEFICLFLIEVIDDTLEALIL